VLGQPDLGRALLRVLVGFTTLEATLGFCAGCVVFRQLMRWGWAPEETCERCNNLSFSAGNAA
jgi:hypothetical protein